MSTTQISQTLFRFVSLRNPQLSDDNEITKRFIFRPAGFASAEPPLNFFDQAINEGDESDTKWTILYDAAADFQNSSAYLDSLTAIQTLLGGNGIYDFSKWMARNRHFFTKAELVDNVQGSVLDDEILIPLWNNLFYQVVTQKSFYVKEAIMQVLVANHFLAFYQSDDSDESYEKNKMLATAKVVLPKELFVDNINDSEP